MRISLPTTVCTPRTRRPLEVARALMCGALLTACRADAIELPPRDGGLTSIDEDAHPALDSSACADQPDGHACGDERHCVRERCVFNTCGDGVAAGEEECDDGNEVLGDECSPSCKATPATCGDGRLDVGEECDDGNRIGDDACANSCTRNVCGNGRVDPSEECDDHNWVNEDSCSNVCVRHLCRNGVLDPGEECDDGNTNQNDGCTNACKRVTCGDGRAQEQEECDDGNQVDTDACSNDCTANVCGNGRIDPGEACDTTLTASGEPIPDGARCAAGCAGLETDRCGECERREHCTAYQGSDFNLPRFCYDEVPEGVVGVPDWNKRCTDLIRCISRNRCDIGWAIPDAIACYCGRETVVDECFMGINIVGPCVKEWEAATDATPGDYAHVSNLAIDLNLPSGYAYYLAQCHRENCAEECR